MLQLSSCRFRGRKLCSTGCHSSIAKRILSIQPHLNNNDEQIQINGKRQSKQLKQHYFDLIPPKPDSNNTSNDKSTAVEILEKCKRMESGVLHGFNVYAKLSKLRLATLVTLTAMAGYSMNPSACLINSPALLLFTTLGTSLQITSANTINQLMEIEHDSKMHRTRSRILPSGEIETTTAWRIAIGSGIAGTCVLWNYCNPVTAMLGLSNLLLYTCVYTPMKRTTVWNTHVGSLVGAIPPLMGWTAVSGGDLIGDSVGGLLFAGILFAWQFPHFNALSHNIRHDYLQAGYKMMANADPVKNALISLRWTLGMFPLSIGLTMTGVCTDMFLLTSTIPNSIMLYYAFKFYQNQKQQRHQGNNQQQDFQQEKKDKNARNLFLASLFHMPAIVMLSLFHKKHWYHIQTDEELHRQLILASETSENVHHLNQQQQQTITI